MILNGDIFSPLYSPDDLEGTVSKFYSFVFREPGEVTCLTLRELGNKECLEKDG